MSNSVNLLAPGVSQLTGRPRHSINAYVVDDVLVDAATRWRTRSLLNTLKEFPLSAHVLTHAHPDHQGVSARICEEFDVPLWCHENEREAASSGDLLGHVPVNTITRVQEHLWTGAGAPVSRTISEGDSVGSFTVLETPGHAPGHVSLWREADGTLIAGDVLLNLDLRTGRPGLHEPPAMFTTDPEQNRNSARKLAALEPELVCFGHGPPLKDPAALSEFVESL